MDRILFFVDQNAINGQGIILCSQKCHIWTGYYSLWTKLLYVDSILFYVDQNATYEQEIIIFGYYLLAKRYFIFLISL